MLEESKQIKGSHTLKNLSFKVNLLTVSIILLFTIVLTLVGQRIYKIYYPDVYISTVDKIISTDTYIAHSPDNKDANIIFVDRKTNQIKLILPEDIATKISLLKWSDIQDKLPNSTKNKKN